MKKWIWIVIIVVAIIILACLVSEIKPDITLNNENPIKIGAVLSLTGPAAPFGEYAKNGINLAVDEINNKGGINSRKVEVIIEDDHTDSKTAISAYQKLTQVNKVQGVIGGVWDFTAQPLIPIAHNAGLAFISPQNFRIDKSFELNDQSFVLLTDFNKTLNKLESILAKDSIKKIAVVHFKSSFGEEIARTISELALKLNKGKIVDESYNQIGNNDFKTTILKLKSAGVDTVFLDMLDVDPVNFLQRSKELSYHPQILSYNAIADSFQNKDVDKTLLNGAILLNWEVNTPEFIKLYQAKYSSLPAKSADKHYDAVYVLAKAISENSDLSKVASYIENNSFTTINGTISFEPTHSVKEIPVHIQAYIDGALVDLK